MHYGRKNVMWKLDHETSSLCQEKSLEPLISSRGTHAIVFSSCTDYTLAWSVITVSSSCDDQPSSIQNGTRKAYALHKIGQPASNLPYTISKKIRRDPHNESQQQKESSKLHVNLTYSNSTWRLDKQAWAPAEIFPEGGKITDTLTSAPLGCIAGSRQRIADETLKIHGVCNVWWDCRM